MQVTNLSMDSYLEYILTEHRGIFAMFFLVPLSIAYEIYFYARNKAVFNLKTQRGTLNHEQKVVSVQAQVKKWNATQRGKTLMCTARPGWQTISLRVGKYKETHTQIKIDMADIVKLDTKAMTVKVEPMVTMGQITALLLPEGWTLPVLPELDDLTVGGLVSGFGIESSSHKYGLFQHICKSFEIVTADGSLVHCSESENPDLFYNIPWAYGTLGFIVGVELSIIPAKKYAHVTYTPCYSQEDYCSLFSAHSLAKEHDFVEGLVYSKSTAVIMTASMTDNVDYSKYNPIGNYYKPWFFKHVETFLTRGTVDEYIPLRHYYHRHTRSLFWELQDIFPFGNNPIFRYLLGWTSPPKLSLMKITQTETTRKLYEQHHVVQDFLVPLSTLSRSIDVCDAEFGMYPLWLSPMAIYNKGVAQYGGLLKPATSSNGTIEEMFVDVGAYGNPERKPFVAKTSLRKVEKFIREVQGYQALYADCYMDLDEFRTMFHHAHYDKLRLKYQCESAFPQIFDKICKANRH